MKRRSAASLCWNWNEWFPKTSNKWKISSIITLHVKRVYGDDNQMLSGIKAYPDASCNLQMLPTDFCLRATITSGPLIGWWVLSLPLIGLYPQLTMGWLRFQGKVQLWQATDLPLVFPRSLFPSEIISSLSVPAHDQMSGTDTAFPRLWLVDWAPVWPLIGPWQLCDTVSATHILWHGSIRMSGYIIVTLSQ